LPHIVTQGLGHAGYWYFQQPRKPLGGLGMEPHENGQPVDGFPPQGCVYTLFGIHWHDLFLLF
jgi:hypothetical protein